MIIKLVGLNNILKISRKIAFLYVLIQLYFFNILQTYSNDTVKSTVKGIFIEFELEKEQNNRKNALQKSYLIGLERYLDWITISSQKTCNPLEWQLILRCLI